MPYCSAPARSGSSASRSGSGGACLLLGHIPPGSDELARYRPRFPVAEELVSSLGHTPPGADELPRYLRPVSGSGRWRLAYHVTGKDTDVSRGVDQETPNTRSQAG